jgi:hypothetical protein
MDHILARTLHFPNKTNKSNPTLSLMAPKDMGNTEKEDDLR